MIGLSTAGRPRSSSALRSSLADSTKRYGEVGRPSSCAAKRRMPSLFIVRCAARAVGTTCRPWASSSTRTSVAIASISGTTRCGRSSAITARRASPSSIDSTWLRCATCIAGASAYRSHATTSHPRRWSSMATSLPSSPDPNNRTRVADGLSGVPIGMVGFVARTSRCVQHHVGPAGDSGPVRRSAPAPHAERPDPERSASGRVGSVGGCDPSAVPETQPAALALTDVGNVMI